MMYIPIYIYIYAYIYIYIYALQLDRRASGRPLDPAECGDQAETIVVCCFQFLCLTISLSYFSCMPCSYVAVICLCSKDKQYICPCLQTCDEFGTLHFGSNASLKRWASPQNFGTHRPRDPPPH